MSADGQEEMFAAHVHTEVNVDPRMQHARAGFGAGRAGKHNENQDLARMLAAWPQL
jgi:hypothetical protein